jgi:hypothetical protein
MRPVTVGAPTPEDLDTLLEDAFVLRDATAVASLFEPDAVVATGDAASARGAAIAAFVAGLWARDVTYVPGPRRVLQARDTALIVTEHAIGVVHRAADERWRYAIALLDPDPDPEEPTS